MKRAGAAILACAASCSIYGSSDDAARQATPPISDPTDAGDAANGGGGEANLTNDPEVTDDASSNGSGNPSPADATTETGPSLPDLIAFVTSTTSAGKLDGSGSGEGAGDKICDDLAIGFLPRRFKAWLGGSTGTARTRIIDHVVGRRYRRVDGLVIANRAEQMVDGALLAAINIDERGLFLPLDTADIRVRLLGLDLDPGWLPWFGRVIRFQYPGRRELYG